MVCDSCLVRDRKAMMTPMVIGLMPVIVRLGTPATTRIPPKIAMTTYMMLPTLAKIGIRALAVELAVLLASNSCSFSLSKSFLASSSWLKTFTTFMPSIISSMKPSSSASDFCCAFMNLALLPPNFLVMFIMTVIMTITISVIQML